MLAILNIVHHFIQLLRGVHRFLCGTVNVLISSFHKFLSIFHIMLGLSGEGSNHLSRHIGAGDGHF